MTKKYETKYLRDIETKTWPDFQPINHKKNNLLRLFKVWDEILNPNRWNHVLGPAMDPRNHQDPINCWGRYQTDLWLTAALVMPAKVAHSVWQKMWMREANYWSHPWASRSPSLQGGWVQFARCSLTAAQQQGRQAATSCNSPHRQDCEKLEVQHRVHQELFTGWYPWLSVSKFDQQKWVHRLNFITHEDLFTP